MTFNKIAVALVSGTLFGAGLAVSGMTNPSKVLNFLDLSGQWDPSLALVMASAIPVAALTFYLAQGRQKPVLAPAFVLPRNTKVDVGLVAGSALFGLGWGLGGYCPGPAVASLGNASLPLFAFLAAMTIGLLVSSKLAARLKKTPPRPQPA